MSNKIRTGIILDAEVYHDAKNKYPNLSHAINDLLSKALRLDDEETVLREKSEKLQIELGMIQNRLSEIDNQKRSDVVSDMDKVMDWAIGVSSRKGVVGLNMLRNECRKYSLSVDDVRVCLEADGVELVNYA